MMQHERRPPILRLLLSVITVLSYILILLCSFQSASYAQDEISQDDEVRTGGYEEEIWDPIEPVNRGIFWFNDKFDRYLLEPIAKGYEEVIPDPIQIGVGNFFSNLRQPVRMVNSLLQLEFERAGRQTGRFLINTIVGLTICDVAKEVGLPREEEDLGATLATYGIPHGPYIVLPFLGPSSLREAVGRGGDSFLDPIFYITEFDLAWEEEWAVTGGLKTLDAIDTRAGLIDAIDASRESSLDEYLFVQSAWYQYRRGVISNGNVQEDYRGEDQHQDISFDEE